jgi:hypothetical protein
LEEKPLGQTLDLLPKLRPPFLFAAPYAKRPHRAGEVEAAPAAASDGPEEWNGLELSNDSASQLSTLPLLM